jgi:hypothetical protein
VVRGGFLFEDIRLEVQSVTPVTPGGRGSAKAAKVQGLLTAHQNALTRFQRAAKTAQDRLRAAVVFQYDAETNSNPDSADGLHENPSYSVTPGVPSPMGTVH